MTKFRVGDRVRALGSYGSNFTKGKEYEVGGEYHNDSALYARVGIVRNDEGEQDGWKEKFFELVTHTGPVIEETVKRIVPGVYGRVEVRTTAVDRQVCIGVTSLEDNTAHFMSNFSAAELRAAAVVLNQLAEALE